MRIPRLSLGVLQDYSALITIAEPGQLTQELIDEKLGLDYHVQKVPSGKPSHEASPTYGETRESREPSRAPSMTKDNGVLPPTPPTIPSPQTKDLHSVQSGPRYPGIQSISLPIPGDLQKPGSASRARDVSTSGSAVDTGPDRQRKISLTSRLGKAFGNPNMQSTTSSQASGGSPGSPSGTSKFKSSITNAFRRTSAESAPHARADSPDAPPVPPKDDQSPHQAQRPTDGPGAGQFRAPAGDVSYTPTLTQPSPRSDSLPHNPRVLHTSNDPTPDSVTPSNIATLNHSSTPDNHLSPSPSAQRMFTEARIKSLTQEEEIQNRFRRDLHLEDSGPSSRQQTESIDDPDEDLRLPYDVSDENLSDHHADREPVSRSDSIPQAMKLGRPLAVVGDVLHTPTRDPEPSHHDSRNVLDSDVIDTEEGTRRAEPEIRSQEELLAGEQEEQKAAEGQLYPEEQDRLAQEAEIEANRAREAESARLAEEEQLRVREEEARLARQAEDDERKRVAEQERLAKEAEELQLREAEDARRKVEEEKQLRIALEEQRLIEEARLREEETRRLAEEKRQLEAEKLEVERLRKEGIKQSLQEGKSSGGIMLRGVSTNGLIDQPRDL